jgi:hypothetical protein
MVYLRKRSNPSVIVGPFVSDQQVVIFLEGLGETVDVEWDKLDFDPRSADAPQAVRRQFN